MGLGSRLSAYTRQGMLWSVAQAAAVLQQQPEQPVKVHTGEGVLWSLAQATAMLQQQPGQHAQVQTGQVELLRSCTCCNSGQCSL